MESEIKSVMLVSLSAEIDFLRFVEAESGGVGCQKIVVEGQEVRILADRVNLPSFTTSAHASNIKYQISNIKYQMSNLLITFAGTPPTMAFAGTSLVTTAPAATMAFSPIVTPCKTVTFAPSHTLLPICIGLAIMPARCAGSGR